MNKAKFILLNSIVFVPVTAAVVSVAIELVWMFLTGSNSLRGYSLLSNFIIGLIIGTAVILLNLLAMVFEKRPMIGYVLSFFGVLVLLVGVYLHTGLKFDIWTLDAKWLIIFILSEALTILAVYFWRKQVTLYNTMLERKKDSISAK